VREDIALQLQLSVLTPQPDEFIALPSYQAGIGWRWLRITPSFTPVGLGHLSRDSLVGQRMAISLGVEGLDGVVDGAVERLGIDEGLVSEVVSFEVAPGALDVVGALCRPLGRAQRG
jgi:hypothetical protein